MMLLFAIVLFAAVTIGEGVLYQVAYFLALVLVGSYVYARLRLRRLDMRMENRSYRAHVGSTIQGYVHLHNSSRLGTGWMEIVRVSDMPEGLLSAATAVSGGCEQRLEVNTPCYARGIYTIGPLVARTSDPLGLFRVEIRQGEPMKAVVQPPIAALPYFHLPVAESSGEERERDRTQTRTPDVATVREYFYGDSLNQIHWLSTAKRGQLMSKEFDLGRGGDAWIVLDLEQSVHLNQGTERTDEYAAAIAASLANHIVREDHSVGLVAHGDREYLLPPGTGGKQMSGILEMLTLSKTEGVASLASVLHRNRGRFGGPGSLLVITSSTSRAWVPTLRELAYGGLDVAVILIDPASFGGKQSVDEVVAELVSVGIPVYMVGKGDPLASALSRPITPRGLSIFEQRDTPERIRASAI
jgi:uncharacterized protein (DUF58 family)